jgi:hypothetical protein
MAFYRFLSLARFTCFGRRRGRFLHHPDGVGFLEEEVWAPPY